MALPLWLLICVGGRRFQCLRPSPTLRSLGPSYQRRYKSWVSFQGSLMPMIFCAFLMERCATFNPTNGVNALINYICSWHTNSQNAILNGMALCLPLGAIFTMHLQVWQSPKCVVPRWYVTDLECLFQKSNLQWAHLLWDSLRIPLL